MEIRFGAEVEGRNVLASPLFNQWRRRVEGWDIPRVRIHNVVRNGLGDPIIIQMSALHEGIDYAITLRGASVDVLTILICEGRRYIARVTQPRIAIGAPLTSNAAGFIEPGETAEQAAGRERNEELVALPHGTLIDLNDYVLSVPVAMAVSAGGMDEEVFFFAEERTVTPEMLASLRRRRTGVVAEGEDITVDVTEYYVSVLELLPMLAGEFVDLKFVLSLLLYNFFLNGGV